MANIRHFRELEVYRLGMETCLRIGKTAKSFPRDELFALTDQIRRSSRSVCSNLAEAWRKRKYPNHFVSKITDAESEAAETQVWLEIAYKSEYISQALFEELDRIYEHILGMLVTMREHPEHWAIREKK